MLKKTTVIIKANPDFIWLNNPRSQGCHQCKQQCDIGTLNKASEAWFNRQHPSRFPRPQNDWGQQLKVGDTVNIIADEQQVLQAALWLYLLPLLGLLGFALLYQNLAIQWLGTASDGMTAISGFAGLLLGFVLVKFKTQSSQDLEPQIRAVDSN